MVGRFYLLGTQDAFHRSVGRYDERGAENAHVFAPVHGFLAPDAEGLGKAMVGIGHEREVEVVFLDELAMGGLAVGANAYNLITGLGKLFFVVAKVAGLGRATRRQVFGIEIQRYLASGIIAQLYLVSILVDTQYIVYFVSYVHNV